MFKNIYEWDCNSYFSYLSPITFGIFLCVIFDGVTGALDFIVYCRKSNEVEYRNSLALEVQRQSLVRSGRKSDVGSHEYFVSPIAGDI